MTVRGNQGAIVLGVIEEGSLRVNQSYIVVALTIAPEEAPGQIDQAMLVIGLKRRDRRVMASTY